MTTFQILNIFAQDESLVDDDNMDDESLQHYIYLFGRTLDSKTVCVKTPFQPYFFIELPEYFTTTNIMSLTESIKRIAKKDLISCSPVQRTKFVGFTNQKKFPFLRIIVKNKAVMYRVIRACKSGIEVNDRMRSFPLYETNVDTSLRFLHITDLQSCGWTTVTKTSPAENSICDIDLVTNDFRNFAPADIASSAPFVICSFDIEVFSHDDSFPKTSVPQNVVFQIACTFQKFGSTEPYLKSILCLGPHNPINDVEVIVKTTEKDLLLEFPKLLRREQVDVLVGYNIWGFDWKYLYDRARYNKCTEAFSRISKLEDFHSELYKKTFSSDAYGTTEHELPKSPGIFQIDLLVTMRRDHKLDSYKLDNVSAHFLGEHKLDVSPKEIFAMYRSGEPSQTTRVAEYCVQDTLLPLRLMDKLAIFTNLIEMANVTYVPIDYLILRGQQIKCFSQITRETRKRGMLVKTMEQNNNNQEYQGATVLDPKRGFYKEPISCLDFASLYPSIMRAHKLCHSNWVNSKEFDDLEGVQYYSIEWYDDDNELHRHKFAQNEEGVLPYLLAELAKSRTQAKKDMKNAKTPFEKSIYNGKQLAYKVSMNSLYGFCGAVKTGMLPCKAISETVTARGREMILETKNFIETHYAPAYVVYGDSVSGDTPILLQDQLGRLRVCAIDQVVTDYNLYGEKEISHCKGLKVWTERGFTELKNVIRHKTSKQMYRIVTRTGIVDCTEDHSLLLEDGSEVSPTQVSIGTKLLHTQYPIGQGIGIYTTDPAHGYEAYGFTVGNTGENIPSDFLSASLSQLYEFWKGYCKAKHTKLADRILFVFSDKVEACKVSLIAHRLGYKVRFDSYMGLKISIECVPSTFQYNNDTEIQRIIPLGPCNDYVYDLTTENHHFHVGPGHLVVHNTDSVFCNFGPYVKDVLKQDPRDMELQFKIGFEAGERCSDIFPKPVELEFEKTYYPLLLQNKKRYAGLMYECSDHTKPVYIDKKGLSIVRRDSCKLTKEACMQVLDVVMTKIDVMEARQVARKWVEDLLTGKVSTDKLVVSKSLRDSYASENLPHVHVAKKLELRNPGSGPKSPERVPYLFIESNEKEQYKRAEDPEYVKMNQLKVDFLYYFEHQLKNPMESLFELISEDYLTMFDDLIRKYRNKKRNQLEITSFFK